MADEKEFISADGFKVSLAIFTCNAYEAERVDPENINTPYGFLCVCSNNSEAAFNGYAELLLEDAIMKGGV